MEKHLQRKENKDLQKKPSAKILLMQPFSPFWPFVSFRYSSWTIYYDGEKTHIKTREKKFENGHFDSEEFEATIDKNVYEGMVEDMQRAFFKQMELFFTPFSLFLSGPDNKRD